jgi:hypothetical protein
MYLALCAFQQDFRFGLDIARRHRCERLGVELQCVVKLLVDKSFVGFLQNRHFVAKWFSTLTTMSVPQSKTYTKVNDMPDLPIGWTAYKDQ